MVGSSLTMAMRRDIAGEYSPSGVQSKRLPSLCQNCSARCHRRAARGAGSGSPMPSRTREARVKHLVRFLGLAAGLAFAAGMVLAGIALLLAMPTYAVPLQ